MPHASLAEAAADVAQTLLGMMGIGEGVTDNASVNVLPLVREGKGGERRSSKQEREGRREEGQL